MKTFTTISVLFLALSINVTAQVKGPRHFEPRNQPHTDPAPQSNNNPAAHYGNGWNGGSPHNYVSFNFGFGNPYPYNSYYGNGYNMRKAAKYSIRSAGQLINQAVAFNSWNDIYSPILAKAIRHYNYAKQLYWWGNYQVAYNHAERAGYLAWYSLQYFQNPDWGGNYNNGYQPDPYSDPYNPYYRTNQAGGKTVPQQNAGNKTIDNAPDSDNLDKVLPGSEANDRQLIKSFDNADMKDE